MNKKVVVSQFVFAVIFVCVVNSYAISGFGVDIDIGFIEPSFVSPIANLPTETISNIVSADGFEWNSAFDISFID